MFSKMSLKAKLLFLCILLCLLSGVVGAIGFFGLRTVVEHYDFIATKSLPKIQLADKMFLEYRRVRITLRTLGIQGLDAKEAQKAIDGAIEAIEHFEAAKKEYVALGFAPGQKEYFDKVDVAWDDFKITGGEVIRLYKTGKPEDFQKMIHIFLNDCPQKAKIFTEAGTALIKYHDDAVDKRIDNAQAAADTANGFSLGAILIGIIAGMAFGISITVSLTKSIGLIIQKLSENADQVTSASSQIASSSEELSQSATEQASSLEETAASLEEITAMIAKATENAESTATSSSESKEKSERGRVAVDQMLNSMNEISDSNEAIMAQINESNQQMADIVKVIQEIGNKTKVINEIVFQTKLLSFNASVEAARAGEHGKGFAVVAEEVGNLAQMSGNAAKDISDMLAGSILKVEKIVEETKTRVQALIQRGKEKVESGTQVAHQCSDVLNEILQNVSEVSRLSREISQASKEQSQGVAEINKAMGQLDTVTQQNSASSEETASAAEELSAQAESLKSVVDDLVTIVHGTSGQPAVHQAKRDARSPKSHESKVVHLKAPVKKSSASEKVEFKAVAGGVPSRDDEGFRDI